MSHPTIQLLKLIIYLFSNSQYWKNLNCSDCCPYITKQKCPRFFDLLKLCLSLVPAVIANGLTVSHMSTSVKSSQENFHANPCLPAVSRGPPLKHQWMKFRSWRRNLRTQGQSYLERGKGQIEYVLSQENFTFFSCSWLEISCKT